MSGASGAQRWQVNTDAVIGAGSGAPVPEGIGDQRERGTVLAGRRKGK